METIVVTGGAGFIGSNFARIALKRNNWRLIVVDKLTYAGSQLNLSEIADEPRYSFIHADIADQAAMTETFERWHPEIIVNFAAETHVDRSIDGPHSFLITNVMGTFGLLEATRRYWSRLESVPAPELSFLQVSTMKYTDR